MVSVYGVEDRVIKCIPRLNEIKFKMIKNNVKYSSVTYMAKPTKYTTELIPFINAIRDSAQEVVENELKIYKGLKLQFILNYIMSKGETKSEFYDYCYAREVINEFDANELLLDIDNKFNNREAQGSGWKFERCISLYIHMHKYSPIQGSTYVELPKSVKRYCVNVKNTDNECFKLAILSKEHKTGKIRELNKLPRQYDFEYLMKIRDIPKFEKMYNKCIVVYAYDNDVVYPIHKSANITDKLDDIIQLLYYKNHYVWINKPNALFRKANKNNWLYKCPICLVCQYKSKKELQNHLKNGYIINKEFLNYQKKKMRSIIYALMNMIHDISLKTIIEYI